MTTFDKIKDMIVDQLDVEADEVTMDANIQEDLGADSLDIVDLIMAVEDEFEVKIDDDASENIKTVGDIVQFIDATKEAENSFFRFRKTKPPVGLLERGFLLFIFINPDTWEYIPLKIDFLIAA